MTTSTELPFPGLRSGVELVPTRPHAGYLSLLSGATVVVGQAGGILSASELEAIGAGVPVVVPVPLPLYDAEQIVDDWYDNQRVDKLYPIHCYREAIDGLPLDIKDYSNAQDAILRALAYRQANEPDPGGNGSLKPIGYRNTADTVVALPDPNTNASGQANTAGPSSVPIQVTCGLRGDSEME